MSTTGDMVEVVRCKYCRYHDIVEHGYYCTRSRYMQRVRPDDYCSYGKKKDVVTDDA